MERYMKVQDYKIYLDLLRKKQFEKASAFKNGKIPNRYFKYFSLNDNEALNESKLNYVENFSQ
jgi:hypothetical protein